MDCGPIGDAFSQRLAEEMDLVYDAYFDVVVEAYAQWEPDLSEEARKAAASYFFTSLWCVANTLGEPSVDQPEKPAPGGAGNWGGAGAILPAQYQVFHARLVVFFRRKLRGAGASLGVSAEELADETLERALRAGWNPARLGAWTFLKKTAACVFIDHLRRRGPWRLFKADISEPDALLRLLQAHPTQWTGFLWEKKLRGSTRQNLQLAAVLADLRRAIKGPAWYDSGLPPNLALSRETEALRVRAQAKHEVWELNRRLLSDIIPGVVCYARPQAIRLPDEQGEREPRALLDFWDTEFAGVLPPLIGLLHEFKPRRRLLVLAIAILGQLPIRRGEGGFQQKELAEVLWESPKWVNCNLRATIKFFRDRFPPVPPLG